MGRDLKDKVVIITGASSGIGAATAKDCFDVGMRVVAAARRLEKLQAVVEPMGERGLAVTCDVTRDAEVQQLFEQAQQTFGRVDVIFANAGFGLFQHIDRMDDATVRALFETNFYGTMRCIRVGLPYLRQTSDGLKHMMICSSASSEIALPAYGIYAATKASQDMVAQAMRAELAAEGITVTSVHPVSTRTPFHDVAAQKSGKMCSPPSSRFRQMFEQTSPHVARKIVKAIQRPKPEVWPKPLARFGLGLLTMLPGLAAWLLRRNKKAAR